MIKTKLMTRYKYMCDVYDCNNEFHTFMPTWAQRRGWKTVQHHITDEGAWDGLHILHFCPKHTLEDWL